MREMLGNAGAIGSTCDVGRCEVCTRGVEEAGVVDRRSVHVGDKTKLGRLGDEGP